MGGSVTSQQEDPRFSFPSGAPVSFSLKNHRQVKDSLLWMARHGPKNHQESTMTEMVNKWMMIFELCKHHSSDYLCLSSLLWCSYVWHEVPTKITKENNSELFQDFFSCSFWLAQLIKGTWVVTRKTFFSLLWNQSQTVVKLGKRIQYGLLNEKEWSVGFVLMKQWLSWFSLFVRQNGFPINNLCLNNKKKNSL